jgi:PAS domain S-box-containing protein
MKSAFLDKLMERLDRLDAGSLQSQFLRLANDKGLLETIFHAIQEGLVVLDADGLIRYANRAAEKLLGFSAEQAAGYPIARYLREIDWNLVLDLDADEWSKLISREIEITYPEHRFLDFYIVPLTAVEVEQRGAVVILRDVTRDRESESRTIESERLHAITLLAAGVAHEIGNPLNSLTIHLQLLERELREVPAEQAASMKELLEVAQREVTRLDQIISQFLRALRPRPARAGENRRWGCAAADPGISEARNPRPRHPGGGGGGGRPVPHACPGPQPDQAGLFQHHPQRHAGHGQRRAAQNRGLLQRPLCHRVLHGYRARHPARKPGQPV